MIDRAKSLALAGLSGCLLVALFPAFNLAYLSPLALVPLLMALEQEPGWKWRFVLGWAAGCIFWGGTCYWIYEVQYVHGRVPAVGAAALFAVFFLIKGLHLGVFGWLAGGLLRRSWGIPAVAALWVAIEGTHPYLGFTWLMLGNAAADMAVVARLAPITGVAGMSFVLAMMNVAVAFALLRRPKKHLAWLLAVPLLYGLPSLPAARAGSQLAHLVQPNISEIEVYSNPWTEERAQKLLDQFAALSSAGSRRPDLIIWPENPAPLYFYNDALFRSYVEAIAQKYKTYLLISTVAFRAPARQPLNSAVLVGPDGEEIARYDKIHLVPFGEFVPWPFGYLVEKITREAGDFVPGQRTVVGRAGRHYIGTFICYESVFSSGVRRFVAEGAEVLVNLSNDGWYGQSAARDQHLLIARLRAAENGRWLLRSTNSGLTAAIDPAGQVAGELPPDRPGSLLAGFEYLGQMTLYTRWGDWFWWATMAAAAGAKLFERLHP